MEQAVASQVLEELVENLMFNRVGTGTDVSQTQRRGMQIIGVIGRGQDRILVVKEDVPQSLHPCADDDQAPIVPD